MIELTDDEFARLQARNNWVIVEPLRKADDLYLGTDADGVPVKWYMDSSYEPEKHAGTRGVVIKHPNSLIYCDGYPGTMERKVKMEVQVGDVVWFRYLAALNAFDPTMRQAFKYRGRFFIMVHYSDLFVAKRQLPSSITPKQKIDHFKMSGDLIWQPTDFAIIPLNGYCLLEPMQNEKRQSVLSMPDSVSQNSERRAKVAYTGSLVEEYYFSPFGPYPPDDDCVKPGDVVILGPDADVLIEYDLHNSFEGKKQFFRVERYLMMGRA